MKHIALIAVSCVLALSLVACAGPVAKEAPHPHIDALQTVLNLS